MDRIVIATIKSWNIKYANELKDLFANKLEVFVITERENLKVDLLSRIKPKYIFLPHWSWKVPEEIYRNFECIAFHITDLPFGRGGSPLQNLIKRKIYNTKISAFRIQGKLDSGDIYLKRDFYIGLGSAEEILITASKIIFFEMIPYIIENNPKPYKQEGEVVVFKRLTPKDSNIQKADLRNIDEFYDFVRMLDGEGYPKAFLKLGKLKIFFSEIHKKTDGLVGRFEVIEDEEDIGRSSTS